VVIAVALGVSALTGCSRETKEPQPRLEGAPHGPSPAPSPAEARPTPATPLGEVAWDVPETWKQMPPRPMRKATYEAPAQAGPAEIAVFYFGPDQGGGVEQNIQRWIGQFQGLPEGAAERSEEEINGMKRVNVSIKNGTYESGMPGAPSAPKENFAMSASIVQTPAGHYYFKMTGPSQSVAERRADFDKLLGSIRFEKKN
jgi:hypothetical protein